jgi:hypothetical protein
MSGVLASVMLVLSLASPALISPASAWDAGPASCEHTPCSGGVNSDGIPDTKPAYAKSRLPRDECSAGSELYGSVCYHACPGGWERTAVCTCKKKGVLELQTDCKKYGSSGTPSKQCPSGTEYYGGLCYDSCPAGSKRTAVSTCVHEVKWRSNTHLWVVDIAINLLANTNDLTKKVAARMTDSGCRWQWEAGLWDADNSDLAETKGARGGHFYNVAGLDFEGHTTQIVTYAIAGTEQKDHGNARTNAQAHINKIGNLTTSDQCHELGLALHYLTDMTQPMHASSFPATDVPINLHPVFEDYVGNVQARFPATGVTWDGRWEGLTPDVVLSETSRKSNSLAPALYKVLKYDGTICTMTSEPLSVNDPPVTYTGYCFINVPAVDDMIGVILKDAYQSTASYIFAAVFPTLPRAAPK